MEVKDSRSALLSNYEVLNLLQELESEQVGRAKANFLVKKEQHASDDPNASKLNDIAPEANVSENLRTIEYEIIQYLSADYQPMRRQSKRSVQALTSGLRKYDLTKAEKLQIVNLAPTEPVELYVIVEELEERLESMEEVLELVKSTLSDSPEDLVLPASLTNPHPTTLTNGTNAHAITTAGAMQVDEVYFEEEAGDMVADNEAGGFEGDLEMGDDDE